MHAKFDFDKFISHIQSASFCLVKYDHVDVILLNKSSFGVSSAFLGRPKRAPPLSLFYTVLSLRT